ncbi:MAG: transcriptional regulator [Betaproteobacteria bacterium RIFCSPHIGHO2_12_FULL_69_13]|nr:MAG: transcriptional regulator [Betaproteobacteria bacterium RIFCSPHIGHO2_12_FULL_69_13]OGA68316.1 MAG: transcriptional regulator [Betaproteobacteria bacterium RIFCSPLOWO2_12_FULL_68_20]
MRRIATIRIERDTSAALERGARRFVRAWKSAKDLGSDFSFESPEALFRSLTPARWAVVERLQAIGASTLRGLARELGRDVKSVHRDVHALIAIGLVEKDGKGRLLVPFSRIRAEFDLQAKRAA